MELNSSHPTELDVIEDVGASTHVYINEKWGKKFYIPLIILILISLGVFIWIRVPLGFFLAGVWYVVGWVIAHKRVQAEFFRQFAEKNGFVYSPTADRPTEGDLFGRGYGSRASHALSGERDGLPVRFFFYSYTIGSGKNQQTHEFTVAEIIFGGSLPDIIVDSRDDMYVDGGLFGKFKTLKVGNGFDEYFTLKVPEDLEIEALEVFTPEIMEQLMERGRGYSFEFIGTKLYVWNTGYIRKSSQLRELLSLAQYLITALAPRLARLSDDVEAYRSAKR